MDVRGRLDEPLLSPDASPHFEKALSAADGAEIWLPMVAMAAQHIERQRKPGTRAYV